MGEKHNEPPLYGQFREEYGEPSGRDTIRELGRVAVTGYLKRRWWQKLIKTIVHFFKHGR